MKIEILFENSDIVAINKPAGVLVHPDGRSAKKKTIVDWILKNYPNVSKVGDDLSRPGIVHRLDEDTSGVLLIAKNKQAFVHLKKLFEQGEVKKSYLAIVCASVKNDRGIIDRPIGRGDASGSERRVGSGATGTMREALTYYKVLERFDSSRDGGPYSLVEFYPKTGRTHQIRVHAKSAGFPVACDKLYGKVGSCPMSLTRKALHAIRIEFKDTKGEIISIEAPPLPDFSGALESLRKA
ncbi:MAG: RluA family pseudouridine synthase [Patescibacteria group bacterium]